MDCPLIELEIRLREFAGAGIPQAAERLQGNTADCSGRLTADKLDVIDPPRVAKIPPGVLVLNPMDPATHYESILATCETIQTNFLKVGERIEAMPDSDVKAELMRQSDTALTSAAESVKFAREALNRARAKPGLKKGPPL